MHKALSVTAAVIVLAIGIGTLAEYALDVDLHIDQLLLAGALDLPRGAPHRRRRWRSHSSPFQSSSVTSARPRSARPSEWLVFSASVTALTALMGFIFGAGPLYRLSSAPVIGVAVPTAMSLLLMSMGLLLERPTAGIMRVATSTGPGGVLLRRLAIPVILAPVLLGLVVMRFAAAMGIEDPPVVVAMLAATLTGGWFVRYHSRRRAAQSRPRALEASRKANPESGRAGTGRHLRGRPRGSLHRRQRRRLPMLGLCARRRSSARPSSTLFRRRTSNGSGSQETHCSRVRRISTSGDSAPRTAATCPWR